MRTLGSSTTSCPNVTSASRYTVDGSRIVTPARIQRSLSSTRMSHSARASWARSLMPVSLPSSSVSSAATSRPSSRANATRSVRYSSPEAGEGRRSPIRRRSHGASIAYRPALISAIWRSSSVASLSSTIRSTVPPSLRTTRPRPVGSTASTDTSAIAAWSSARASSSADRSAGWTSGTSPESTRTSSTPSGRTASAARTASPVPRGSAWRAVAARPATASRTASVAGEYTTSGSVPVASTAASST